jgi:hypothetical protein
MPAIKAGIKEITIQIRNWDSPQRQNLQQVDFFRSHHQAHPSNP